ncbi:MAG: THUMP domain-containing protein [Candidatus Woesearchaeota archaeon]
MESCILLRYGEVAVKSRRKRPFFERLFVNAISDALSRHEVDFDRIENLGKLYAVFPTDLEEARDVLGLVPGIESYSLAWRFSFSSKQELVDTVFDLASDAVVGKTFRVTAKRLGKQSFSSMELARDIGSMLAPKSAGVDLSNPQKTIFVEVRENQCYVFYDYIPGLGGLPPRSVGRSMALFSGGLDSPVAAFDLLKRGCALDYLFVNMVGDTMLSSVSKVYDFLVHRYAYNHVPRFFHVDARKLSSYLKESVPERLRQLAFKMALYMISERIAREHGLSSFATGESLSQKSSQTLASLDFIQQASSMLVLRPLISRDKHDIIAIARRIGTFAASEKVKEQCNLSEGPVTAIPSPEDLDLIPDLDGIVQECVDSVEVFEGALDLDTTLCIPCSEIDIGDAVVVDIRTPSVQKKHPVGADITTPYPAILDHLDLFTRERSYIIVCSQGVLSHELAHILSGRNIKATALSLKEYEKFFNKE